MLVRSEGLEPPCLAAPDFESGVSATFTTSAVRVPVACRGSTHQTFGAHHGLRVPADIRNPRTAFATNPIRELWEYLVRATRALNGPTCRDRTCDLDVRSVALFQLSQGENNGVAYRARTGRRYGGGPWTHNPMLCQLS